MDRATLIFLLKEGHMDMPTRIKKGLWPHSPLQLKECIEALSDYLEINKYFPVPWVEKKDGELIGDLDTIEKNEKNQFIYRYRYSNPINLLKISDKGEKVFQKAQDAAEYYLRNVLYLPGDLDGWKVIEDRN